MRTYESVMQTARAARHRAIHPRPPGCRTAREDRLQETAMLAGIISVLRHLPLTGQERAALFWRLHETILLISWLNDIAAVLAGRREPMAIGPPPREVRVIHRALEG